MDKFNADVQSYIISGSIDYGLAEPLEMIEDKDSQPVGFRIDARNYLAEHTKEEIIKKID